MKLRKVRVNGKTYYEEINEDEVIEPEIIDAEPKEKETKEENSSFKDAFKKKFNKEALKNDLDEFVDSMKDLGDNISKKFKGKNWKQKNKNQNEITNKLVRILPYMEEDDIHEIVEKIIDNDEDFKDLDYAAIMPFMSSEDCDALFMKTLKEGESISFKMVHFVSEDCLSLLVEAYLDGKYPNLDVDALYPFLDSEDIKKIFYYELKKKN